MRMHQTILVLLICFSFAFTKGNCTIDCISQQNASTSCSKTTSKAIADLNSALELITNVRNNYEIRPPESLPIDCEDVLQRGYNNSGVYKVLPTNRVVQNPIEVYCDMETDGGGWTVIQRRGNFLRPKDSFYQDWKTYKMGFGSVEKDFWLGNDNIFALSNQRPYSVRFDLEDVDGNRSYALYDTFWIDDEDHKYTLHIKGYSGTAGDAMTKVHDGKKFSTKDQQNHSGSINCAQERKGGWWYDWCHNANLNGIYHRGKYTGNKGDGVVWYQWRGEWNSLEWTEIKIRRKNFSTKSVSASG